MLNPRRTKDLKRGKHDTTLNVRCHKVDKIGYWPARHAADIKAGLIGKDSTFPDWIKFRLSLTLKADGFTEREL